MPDTTLATLGQIQTKVRRLTRSPSVAQITDVQLNDYINTFVLYDMPEHVRVDFLRTNLTFWTMPYVGEYTDNTIDATNPLFNLKNRYISFHTPVYIAGNQVLYSQSRQEFFNLYPQPAQIAQIAQGDGITAVYAGTLTNVPIMQNNVTFSSRDVNNIGLVLRDVPNLTAGGNMATTGLLFYPNDPAPQGTINYVTGAYLATFPNPPAAGVAVNAQTVAYVPTLPQSLLFYRDTFHVRPIPDQPYEVKLEAYIRPTELLAADQISELAEWWQYIAYGAAKKILEDRLDNESVQQIMPQFKEQELLIGRRTIMQQSNERTSTIFVPGNHYNSNKFGPYW